jgi:hypothetical protein
MSGWDVLNSAVRGLPPVALALLLSAAVVAVVIFIIGFTRHGMDFIKYGFKQTAQGVSFEERFDKLDAKIGGITSKLEGFGELGAKIGSVTSELETIKVNHFGHLKNYLGVLNGVLLDKDIIDNETKARLDNELRGM